MDSDGDGVNEEDDCPTVKGAAFLKGCPDGDSDGIADKDDKCPTVAGVASNKGCPEIPKEIITQITKIASKIFFETGSDKLKTARRPSSTTSPTSSKVSGSEAFHRRSLPTTRAMHRRTWCFPKSVANR